MFYVFLQSHLGGYFSSCKRDAAPSSSMTWSPSNHCKLHLDHPVIAKDYAQLGYLARVLHEYWSKLDTSGLRPSITTRRLEKKSLLTGAVFRIAQTLILPVLAQLLDVTLPLALDENVPGRITVSSVPVIVCRGLPDSMGIGPPFSWFLRPRCDLFLLQNLNAGS